MTKTVQNLIDEYRARQKDAKIETIGITIGGRRYTFDNVVNVYINGVSKTPSELEILKTNKYSFDYRNSNVSKHMDCSGTITFIETCIEE